MRKKRLGRRGDISLIAALMVSLVIAVGVVSNQMMQSSKLKRQIAVAEQLESFGATETAAWHMHYKQKNDATITEGSAPIAFERQNQLDLSTVPVQTVSSRYRGEALNVSATRTLDSEGVFVRRPSGQPVQRKYATVSGASFFCGESTNVRGKVVGVCLVPAISTGCAPIPECGGIDLCPGTLNNPATALPIANAQDFLNMTSNNRYRLTQDIDFGGGSVAITRLEQIFIDGNGHELRNVSNSSSARMGYLAMIGTLKNAVVKNLKLKNISLTAAPGSGVQMGGLAAEATGHICTTGVTLDNVSIRSSGAGSTAPTVSAGGLFGRIVPEVSPEYTMLVNNPPPCPACPGPDPCPCGALPPPYFAPQKVVLQDVNADVDIQDLRTRCYTGMTDSRQQSTGGLVGTASSATTFQVLRARVSGTVKGAFNVGGVIGFLLPANEYRKIGDSQIQDVVLSNLTVEAPQSSCPTGAGIPQAFRYVGGVFGAQGSEGANGNFFTGSLKNVTATNLQVSGMDWVGGLFGGTWGYRYIVDSADVSVSVNPGGAWMTAGTRAGGLGGGGQVEIRNSKAVAQINGVSSIGGILGSWELGSWVLGPSFRGGLWNPTLDNLSAKGTVTLHAGVRNASSMAVGTPDVTAAGGIIGEVRGAIPSNQVFKVTRLKSEVKVVSAVTPLRSGTNDLGGSGRMGGLLGNLTSDAGAFEIENSFASGDVTGTSELGGLVGRIVTNFGGVVARNSYFSGKIISNFASAPARHGLGAIFGQVTGSFGPIGVRGVTRTNAVSSYFDSQKNPALMAPVDPYQVVYGSGVTTGSLSNRNTFVNWDFNTIWQPPGGSTLPLLR